MKDKLMVKIISSSSRNYWYAGMIGKTIEVTDRGDYYFATDMPSDTGSLHKSDCELAWQPTKGEMIEVKYNKTWDKRKFVGMIEDQYVCVDDKDDDDTYDCFFHARPIKTTVTIIKESTGEKVEISQESSTSIFG